MVYYVFISFALFLVIDYIYIYDFFDSKIFLSSSGSKLSETLIQEGKKRKQIFCYFDIVEWTTFVCIFITVFLFNFFILKNFFSTVPVYMFIGKKEIDISYIFGDKWPIFKYIYFLAYGIFILLMIFKFRFSIAKSINKFKLAISGKEIIEKEEKDLGYKFARDEFGNQIYITDQMLYQNLLITGSIGSGKTTGAIANLTYELIKSGKGGLILDLKSNFVDTVTSICKRVGRYKDLKVISMDSKIYFNLIDNSISNLELAYRIRQVIYLLTTTNNSDSYWYDKMENVLLNILIIIQYYNNGIKNIMEIHKMVSDTEYIREKIEVVKKKALKDVPDDKTCFELNNAINFVEKEFLALDHRTASIIKSEITRLTTPLITEYEVYNQFCANNHKNEELILSSDKNQIIVLSINIAKRKSLSKIVSTFLKLSFQKNIISNISNPTPSFFIADEYQEFVNVEDANFLSIAREAKCINILSTQSYSSLRYALKDENATSVIIQNLVNKIWFRNDDNYTIAEIVKQLGKVNVKKLNETLTENSQESKKYFLRKGFKNKKSSISKAISYVETKENIIDENYISRELKPFDALVFISNNDGKRELRKLFFERWKNGE